jgi:hypothetical protein
MNHILTLTFGIIIGLTAATYLTPTTTLEVIHQVDDTVHTRQIIDIDLDRIRNTTNTNPDLEERLANECAHHLHQQTGDPLQGIIHYIHRYWSDDACAALEHQLTHGWH